jgi:hypothetical protein
LSRRRSSEDREQSAIGREAPETRDSYRRFLTIPTRWMDNDVYGHVNNVVYYSYFDTVVNEYLIRSGVLDIEESPVIGLVVETQCRFFKPLTFPDIVHAGAVEATVQEQLGCGVQHRLTAATAPVGPSIAPVGGVGAGLCQAPRARSSSRP